MPGICLVLLDKNSALSNYLHKLNNLLAERAKNLYSNIMESHATIVDCGRSIAIAINVHNRKFRRFNLHRVKQNKEIALFTGYVIRPVIRSYNELKNFVISFLEDDASENNLIRRSRGVFAGIHFNVEDNVIYAFVDHIASKALYYYIDEDVVILSTEFSLIPRMLMCLNRRPVLDTRGAYFLISFGYMISDVTIMEKTRKVTPGSIVKLNVMDKRIEEVKRYYRIDNTSRYRDINGIINELNKRFLHIVNREYNADKQIARCHLTTLSAGLDSKVVLLTSYLLGHKDQIALTFSQSNYIDHVETSKIADDLGVRHIFIPLDYGYYLLRIDENIEVNGGLVPYFGAAHMLYALLHLDKYCLLRQAGIVHTGMLGDAILGTYLPKPYHVPALPSVISRYAISKKLLSKAIKFVNFSLYRNAEEFIFYERGINGILNGYRVIEWFTEFYSPFLDVDFLDYALRIDPTLRFEEKIYVEWIRKKMPIALKYKWEKLGWSPVYRGKLEKLLFQLTRIRRWMLRKFLISPLYSMNPVEYWYAKNPELPTKFHEYYRSDIRLIDDKELRDDVAWLFEEGSVYEKMQALTLLRIIRLFNLKTE